LIWIFGENSSKFFTVQSILFAISWDKRIGMHAILSSHWYGTVFAWKNPQRAQLAVI
jgi:hypothetical protein